MPPPVPPPARPRARRHALPTPSHPVPSPPPAIRTRDRPRESFHPRRDHRPRRMGTTRSRASLAPRADPRRGSRFAASLPLERLSRAGSIARDATRRDADWRDGGEIEISGDERLVFTWVPSLRLRDARVRAGRLARERARGVVGRPRSVPVTFSICRRNRPR